MLKNAASLKILVKIFQKKWKNFPSTVLAAPSDPICVSPIPHCAPIISPQPGQYTAQLLHQYCYFLLFFFQCNTVLLYLRRLHGLVVGEVLHIFVIVNN